MPKICVCGHSRAQHSDTSRCNYSGYSCKCAGYEPALKAKPNPNDYPGRFPEKKSIVVDSEKLGEYIKGLVESGAVASFTPSQGGPNDFLEALRRLVPKEEA